MPIDIEDLRAFKGGDVEKVKESERRRFNDPARVDTIIALDETWRTRRGEIDRLRKAFNAESKKMGEYAKQRKEKGAEWFNARKEETKAKTAEIKAEIVQKEEEMTAAATERDALLGTIGNYVHDSVPVFEHEEDPETGALNNGIESTWGVDTRRVFPDSKEDGAADLRTRNAAPGAGPDGTMLHHHELLQMLGGYDPEAGVKVGGSRCYFLRGSGVSLNFALQLYAQNFLIEQSYTLLQPPYFMRKDIMAGVAQLAEFDEALYHVSGGDETEAGAEREKYLIATSEQPICGFHKDEWINEKTLRGNPIKYAGVSTCFRKEAGSSGKDTRGIFRVHQFEKVEQFVIAHPEESWDCHEKMLEQCKAFTQSLGLAYRVVNIVSGDLNNAAAKKYDMEAWFPGYDAYREIVSCSNCLDYQSRSMEIRCGQPAAKSDRAASAGKGKAARKNYVHMLNSTLCACTRLICCILENYQTPLGVVVPEVLLRYMPPAMLKTDEEGRKYMPFIEELKVEEVAKKKKGGKSKKSKKKKGAAGESKEAAAPKAPSTAGK
jgi:seryl-tRNA synthetase